MSEFELNAEKIPTWMLSAMIEFACKEKLIPLLVELFHIHSKQSRSLDLTDQQHSKQLKINDILLVEDCKTIKPNWILIDQQTLTEINAKKESLVLNDKLFLATCLELALESQPIDLKLCLLLSEQLFNSVECFEDFETILSLKSQLVLDPLRRSMRGVKESQKLLQSYFPIYLPLRICQSLQIQPKIIHENLIRSDLIQTISFACQKNEIALRYSLSCFDLRKTIKKVKKALSRQTINIHAYKPFFYTLLNE